MSKMKPSMNRYTASLGCRPEDGLERAPKPRVNSSAPPALEIDRVVVVTRHLALVEYLREEGIIDASALVTDHVSNSACISGRHVIGVLPVHLARYAACVTTIPLDLPPDLRGKELSLEQVRQYAGRPMHYAILTDRSPQWVVGRAKAAHAAYVYGSTFQAVPPRRWYDESVI